MPMSDSMLLKPALYRAEGTERAPSRPALLGGRCACGYVFFPLQAYGCERCGSAELKPYALAGEGTLLASARVHLHAGKKREAPFTVGAIKLDDGPIVRTLLVDDARAFRPGDRMATTLVSVKDENATDKLDLRFRHRD
jgi:uncharacterized OB-fold protein